MLTPRGNRSRKIQNRNSVLFVRGISKHIKDKFKAACASRGTTMTAEIEGFMIRFCDGIMNQKKREELPE